MRESVRQNQLCLPSFSPKYLPEIDPIFYIVRFLDGLIFDYLELPPAVNVDQSVSENVQQHLGTGDPQCNRDMVSDMVVEKSHMIYRERINIIKELHK